MEKRRTLEEWIALYEKKTGEKFEREEGFRLYYFPERGFCEILVDMKNKIVIAYQLCGDGWFWRRMIEFIAKALEYGVCGAVCIRRDIKAYIRFWKMKIRRTETTPEGLERYFCSDEYGKKLTCSPAWERVWPDGKKTYTYFMTWEV